MNYSRKAGQDGEKNIPHEKHNVRCEEIYA
jgi:hypothetical protein